MRTIRITVFCFALVAALLFGVLLSSGAVVASATTTYELGHLSETIPLIYGELVDEPIRYHPNDPTKYYRVVSFNASETLGGATFSLTEDGRVTAEPGTYYLSANGNAVPCYDTGSPIPDANCSGTLLVEVSRNQKTVYLSEKDLTKTYGADGEEIVWTDGTLTVTFDSLGRAKAANVGEYPLSDDYVVMLGGVNRTTYYDVTAKIEETDSAAKYTVLPKEVTIDYGAVEEVRFNDYLLADGESVVRLVKAGENGDELTAFFRLKESQTGALAVGSSHEIEFYRYEVKPSEGDPISYDAEVTSNYSVTVTYTKNTVKAKAGSVIVYQDESKIAERQSDARYLYLPLPTFTYTYFDLVITDLGEAMLGNESLYPSVTFYPGVTGTVRFSVEGISEGVVPVGKHRINLIEYECSDIEDLSFDNVSLEVLPFVIDEPYVGEDEAEITVSNTFEKVVKRTYDEKEYQFVLTADLTGKEVGAEVKYTSLVSETDPNVLIEYGEASVTVVKRSTGVKLVAESKKSVAYGTEIGVLAEPYLGDALLEGEREHVSYRYRSSGSSGDSFPGLPTGVGSFIVSCSLDSALYEVDPVEVELTVSKRQVAVLYHVSTSHKTYGTTFTYRIADKNVQIKEVYPAPAGVADRENMIDDPQSKNFAGELLKSEGCEASADVGTYDFTTRASSPYFEIVKIFVYDVAAGREVNKFTVDKAPAPPAPDPTVEVTSKQEIKVRAAGPIVVRIANNEEMRSYTENHGEDTITFSKIGGKNPLFGETFYVSVRAEAGDNYETFSGWSDPKSVSVPFAAPAVTVSVLESKGAEFTYTKMQNTVAGYRIQYRVGTSGDWKNAEADDEWTIKVGGLRADTSYTVQFRAEMGGIVGAVTAVDIRTLRAPVEATKVSWEYDRNTGVLKVNADDVEGNDGLEYCLCKPSGEEITAWSFTPDFEKVLKDSNYLLKVRYAENEEEELLGSEETVIAIDTHKPKVPVTWRSILSDWFLAIVGGVLLILMIVFIVRFAKTKKKIDREEA